MTKLEDLLWGNLNQNSDGNGDPCKPQYMVFDDPIDRGGGLCFNGFVGWNNKWVNCN